MNSSSRDEEEEEEEAGTLREPMETRESERESEREGDADAMLLSFEMAFMAWLNVLVN